MVWYKQKHTKKHKVAIMICNKTCISIYKALNKHVNKHSNVPNMNLEAIFSVTRLNIYIAYIYAYIAIYNLEHK